MNYLLKIGSGGAVENIFSKYLCGRKCLIVGIGAGGDALGLKNICQYIVGIDLSYPQLLKARNLKVSNCDLLLCDAEQLPFRNDGFTPIVCRATLHHLNVNLALAEMLRILKSGGVIILHEPGLLNPIALIERRFFPTKIHTPDERPFIPLVMKKLFAREFQIMEENYYYIVSTILPIILKHLKGIPVKVKRNLIDYACRLDNVLLKSPLKQLCWHILLVVSRK